MLGKQLQQFLLEPGEGDFPHRLARIDQQVPAARKVGAIQPKHFPHPPTQAIAPHSFPQAHGRGDSQA